VAGRLAVADALSVLGALSFAWVAGRWGVGPAHLLVGAVLLATAAVAGWRAPANWGG
jgi:hypothetical protein